MPDLRNSPIRILIADDHPVVLAGLSSMLSTQPDLDVVGAAAGGDEALQMLRAHRADILLLDLRMPGMNGIDTLLAIRAERINVRAIILTSFETDEDIYRSVQ